VQYHTPFYVNFLATISFRPRISNPSLARFLLGHECVRLVFTWRLSSTQIRKNLSQISHSAMGRHLLSLYNSSTYGSYGTAPCLLLRRPAFT